MQVVGQHVLGLPGMMATGARVSNAYPTCPLPRDSLAKVRLIPHAFHVSHGIWKKGIYTGKGWGCVPLAGWRGNGPPRRRWVGVLRGRSPTLELRHGPNSYGKYWSMGGSLNQPSSVQDDGLQGCKLLLCGNKMRHVWCFACTARIRTG